MDIEIVVSELEKLLSKDFNEDDEAEKSTIALSKKIMKG